MEEGPEYAASVTVGAEKIAASVLVLAWVILAGALSGRVLAIRAAVFFMIPLAFVWIPELMARTSRLTKGLHDPGSPMIPGILRITGWLVLLGVPAVWLAFDLSLR